MPFWLTNREILEVRMESRALNYRLQKAKKMDALGSLESEMLKQQFIPAQSSL